VVWLADVAGGFFHPPQDCLTAESPVPAHFVTGNPAVPHEFVDGGSWHHQEICQQLNVEDFLPPTRHCFISVSDRYSVNFAFGATLLFAQDPLTNP
jgi:hypothetical protein